ncbi:metallophosphoesterase [Actinomadura kijaniata]|uniref:metallophosphoesterase n=1 Tax=Actinomadura kijaniata TaxID=46161 RepID=UPI003F1E34C0
MTLPATLVAHLSDVHIGDDARGVERLRAVMAYLDALAVELDAVVVTGDVADHGRAGEYERAAEALASRHPVLVCPGNHDDRAAFRSVLLGEPASPAPVNRVHRTDRLTLALCDSTIPGRDEGTLADGTLDWLEEVLAGNPPDVPVLIAFHHPPVPVHVPYLDGMRQFGTERLAALVERHPDVAGLLCGHAHTPAATTFAGRPLRIAPGVASALRYPWERQDGPRDVLRFDQPPMVAFHALDAAGRLTTHYQVVPG